MLNAIAGPVNAQEFLSEIRWTVESRKNAILYSKRNRELYDGWFKKAHQNRYIEERNKILNPYGQFRNRGYPLSSFPQAGPIGIGFSKSMQVQSLLGSMLAPKIDSIYKIVYEKILGEKISNQPVDTR